MTDIIEMRVQILYRQQLKDVLEKLKKIVDTNDQDYINQYLYQVIEQCFHKGLYPQAHLKLMASILNDMITYDTPQKQSALYSRDWFKILDKLIHFKVDNCSICGNKLHHQGKYPTDYPDKWKLCCRHLDALQVGLGIGHNTKPYNQEYKKYEKKFEEYFSL